MSKREVTYALTKESKVLFVPGVPNLGPSFSKKPSGTSKGYKMILDDMLVYISTVNEAKKPVTVAVPITTFSHFVVEDEANSKA